jgi:hypothetical protein
MAEYRLTFNSDIVQRTADTMFIPESPHNPEWLEYETWLAGGGVPDPAPLDNPLFEAPLIPPA